MTTNIVSIGGLTIGGQAPIRVESMLKFPLSDYDMCLRQCNLLQESGCELLRVAFPESSLYHSLCRLNKESNIPIMADIHFDPELAILAMEAGCPSIRINPGNMPSNKLEGVIRKAQESGTVIRIGANSGSINTRQLQKTNGDRGKALAFAVEEQLTILQRYGFEQIILSAKSTNIAETVQANIYLGQKYSTFPIHIGITEAGPGARGLVRSAAGLSLLLAQGIGNTLRVSLTADSLLEVEAGYEILRSLGLREKGVHLISCPTCGRKRIDVASIVEKIKPLLTQVPNGITVAVMGCEVNGPREAKSADIGIAGSPRGMILFTQGRIVGECTIEDLPVKLVALIEEIKKEKKLKGEGKHSCLSVSREDIF